MRTPARTLLFYGILLAIYLSLFALLLRYSPMVSSAPVFTRGLIVAAISAVFCLMGLIPALRLPILRNFDLRDLVTTMSIGVMIATVFLIVFPVTVDRSVTVFLLSTIEKAPGQRMAHHSLSRALTGIYVERFDAVDRRMVEQKGLGNIEERPDGTFALTERGRLTMSLIRAISSFFQLDSKFIDPPLLEETGSAPPNQSAILP